MGGDRNGDSSDYTQCGVGGGGHRYTGGDVTGSAGSTDFVGSSSDAENDVTCVGHGDMSG